MRNLRRCFSLLVTLPVVACSALMIGGCSEKSVEHPAKPERPKILVLLNVNENEFFRKIEEGFRKGMSADMQRDYQIDVRYCLKPSDVGYQRTVLDHYFSDFVTGQKDPSLKAVVMAPAGSGDEITGEIKKLRDVNIPVVTVDMRIKADALARAHTDYSAFIGSQNREGGVLAAEQMAMRLPEGGNILVLNGTPGREAAKDRRIGFTEKLAQISKEGQVPYKVTERTADFMRKQAEGTVENLINGGQNFDGIFAANDEMALGALAALHKKQGQNKTVIIGFDAIQEAVKAIQDGGLSATIAQDPVAMGERAAETVDKLLKHQSVEKEQVLPPALVTNGSLEKTNDGK